MMSDSSPGSISNISDFLQYAHGHLDESRLPDENHCDPVKISSFFFFNYIFSVLCLP